MARRDLAQSVDPWGKLLAGGGLLHSSGRLRAPNPAVCENKNGQSMADGPLDGAKYHPSFVPTQTLAQGTRKLSPATE